KATFNKQSRRYRLQSGVKKGDVSLTIINLTEEDSGIYGCRVEIPGLFNDKKLNFNLTVVKDQGKTQIKTNYQLPITTTKSRAASFTEPSLLNVTQAREVQPSCSNQTHFQSQEEDHRPRLPAAILLPLLLLLLLAAILLFMMWLKIQKGLLVPKEPSSSASSIFYVNSVSTLQKAGRETAVENLYQFDAAEAHP
ncbi:hepatitis A virus cellular receptor 1 homolog, partial [Conger conger]|uniref:hepatitis A virus cellular receptor 1 homolog n=1 Tax=Conger conger TaxID=82655 RepID=UPI002A59C7D8